MVKKIIYKYYDYLQNIMIIILILFELDIDFYINI